MAIRNARQKRVALYDYISAIELDLRNYVSLNQLPIEGYEKKILERISRNNVGVDPKTFFETEKYSYLDFSDYYELINIHLKESGYTDSLNKVFLEELKELLPIRNRVMHSRPLSEGDYDTVLSFVKETRKYSSIMDFSFLKEAKSQINADDYLVSLKPSSPSPNKPYVEPTIENNLPLVDYDDTGFIGRDEKKKEIIRKLKSAHPIISVIGNGGIGKTSTVLSCIYDIIDDEDFGFQKVLWVTLKTKSLQDGEFKDLKDSVKSFDECIRQNQILSRESVSEIEHLLFYMECYRTLLILDNLETIDSNEVRPLFEDIPAGSKILITSRIGIGEYETRLKLGPFSQQESMAYFKKLAKCYEVKSLLKTTPQETLSFAKKLYYSPLCIKWFVINVAKGSDPYLAVNNQDELVDFCLSNVYNKLTDNSKKMLMLLFARRKQCSVGELIYLNGDDYAITLDSINELIACDFLEQSSLGQYGIPEFANRYISKEINTKSVDYLDIQKRINKLNGTIENMRFNGGKGSINKPNNLSPSSNNEYIATYYMLSFLRSATKQNIEEMDKWFDLAQKSAPGFCDIYKVAGYAYGKLRSNEKANSHFQTAIQTASEVQLPYIYSFYSLFLTNSGDNYDEALSYIKKALEKKPDDPYFLANYSRVLKFSKKFYEASDVVAGLLSRDDLDFIIKRSMLSEYVDIQARIYDLTYDLAEKDSIFEKTYEFIRKIDFDYYYFPLYKAMLKLFNYALFVGKKSKTRNLIKEYADEYFPYLLFATEDKNLTEFIKRVNDVVGLDIDLSSYEDRLPKREYCYIKTYFADKGYGFAQVKGNARFIYFHDTKVLFSPDKIMVGQPISVVPVFVEGRWQATSIELADEDEE